MNGWMAMKACIFPTGITSPTLWTSIFFFFFTDCTSCSVPVVTFQPFLTVDGLFFILLFKKKFFLAKDYTVNVSSVFIL